MAADRHNNFDLVRLFAAFQVVAGHAAAYLHLSYWNDATGSAIALFQGVAIFFGVSGFLVTRSALDNPPRQYAWRRGLRIYPALWVCILATVAAMAVAGSFPAAHRSIGYHVGWVLLALLGGSDAFAGLFLGGFYNPGTFYQRFPAGALWTITVELTFYALLPTILTAWKRRGASVLIAMFFASVLIGWVCGMMVAQGKTGGIVAIAQLSPLPYLWMFGVGMALQLYWPRLSRYIEGRALWWLLALVAYALCVGGFATNYMHPSWWSVPQTVLLIIAAISCAYTLPKLGRVLRGTDFSYGIYLYHMPVILTLAWLGYAVSAPLWFAAFFLTVLLAVASWFMVERPALRLKSWRSQSLDRHVASDHGSDAEQREWTPGRAMAARFSADRRGP